MSLPGQRSNASDGRIGANRSDDALSLTLYHEGAGNHRVTSRVPNRDAFTADHRLIHRKGMRDSESEISADPVTW